MISTTVFHKMQRTGDSDPGHFEMEWSVPLDLPYLQGHFPGHPVFPAVGIVDASAYALAGHIPRSYLSRVVNAKFLNLIQPEMPLRISFEKVEDGVWDVEWKETSSSKSLATLRLQLETYKS